MTDSYLSISAIANDDNILERLNAATSQQMQLGSISISPLWGDPPGVALSWVANYRYVIAASPGWGEAWDYALNTHSDDATYEPGKDPGVITDGMILSAIQTIAAPTTVPAEEPAP